VFVCVTHPVYLSEQMTSPFQALVKLGHFYVVHPARAWSTLYLSLPEHL
jgi:hypothetical protein